MSQADVEMLPVASSHVDAIGHDGHDTMYVNFKNGTTYKYVGLSYDTFKSILEAPSIGKELRCYTGAPA